MHRLHRKRRVQRRLEQFLPPFLAQQGSEPADLGGIALRMPHTAEVLPRHVLRPPSVASSSVGL